MRPVVPQDRAAAAARAAFALVAVLVATWPVRPAVGLLLAGVTVVYVAVAVRRPLKPARTWVADVADVPRVPAAVASTARTVGVGLALGALGGGVLLLLGVVVLRDSPEAGSIMAYPSGLVLGRAVERLLITRAVRRWEREQGVVLCRRDPPNGVALVHIADVERMVAVPVGRDATVPRP